MEDVFGLWFIVGALLVFFMQAGFAMVEAGFTRAKNAGNIVMKNTLDFSIGAVVFLLVGYGLLSGAGNFFIGELDFGWLGGNFTSFDWSNFFFQLVFCATATTIVSGAMAERTKFSSYLVVTIVICALIYPIETHWVWGGGWLADLGFIDWAGSGVIHMVGGTIALLGAAFLGPRLGKYDQNGRSNAIPGHSITLGALGVFILWFGWYGFNGAAGGSVAQIAQIFTTTTLSCVCAVLAAMILTWVKNGKPDVTYTLNAALAGLVGITAGCADVDAIGSIVIGLVCGFAVVLGCEFIDKKLHIDDPVGASGVHGICGCLGTVLIGFFGTGTAGNSDLAGLFYGGGLNLSASSSSALWPSLLGPSSPLVSPLLSSRRPWACALPRLRKSRASTSASMACPALTPTSYPSFLPWPPLPARASTSPASSLPRSSMLAT